MGRRLTVGEKDYLVSAVVGDRVRDFLDLSLPAIYRHIGETTGRLPAVLVRTDGTKEELVREIAAESGRAVGSELLVRVRSLADLRSNLLSAPKYC